MRPEPPICLTVELHEQEQIVEKKTVSETTIYSVMKERNTVYSTSPIWLDDSGRISINVLSTIGSVFLTLSWTDKPQCLMKTPARLPSPNANKKQKELLWVTDRTALMDLSENEKR